MNNTFYNGFDMERLLPERPRESEDHRTAFQVDRDRILYTSTFRKLQSKTQVFLSGEYDFYRTRLTHSLEVAQIGRSITHWLRSSSAFLSESYFIEPDLVEASCLAHDLGHPPFGHNGEKVLNEMMRSWGGFEGNAQTLRLLTESITTEKGAGMNPSRAFLDSVLKYKTLWSELGGAETPPENHFIYDEQFTYLDWAMGGCDFPVELTPGPKRDAFKSIECQIMDWADDTAYSLNDLADSVRAGFLTTLRVEQWAEVQTLSAVESAAVDSLLEAIKGASLDSFVGGRIGHYVRATELVEEVNILSGQSNRYRYTLVVDPEAVEACEFYKRLSYELVFLQPGLMQLGFKGRKMLVRLWEALEECCIEKKSPDIIPSHVFKKMEGQAEGKGKYRLLADHIASLTDLSAKKFYQRLFDPSMSSITDLVS